MNMRVIRLRGNFGTRIEVAGPQPASPAGALAREPKGKRWAAGRLVPCALARSLNPSPRLGHRHKTMGLALAEDIEAAIIKEAKRRKVAKGTLLRMIVEMVVDDNLFEAVLGD